MNDPPPAYTYVLDDAWKNTFKQFESIRQLGDKNDMEFPFAREDVVEVIVLRKTTELKYPPDGRNHFGGILLLADNRFALIEAWSHFPNGSVMEPRATVFRDFLGLLDLVRAKRIINEAGLDVSALQAKYTHRFNNRKGSYRQAPSLAGANGEANELYAAIVITSLLAGSAASAFSAGGFSIANAMLIAFSFFWIGIICACFGKTADTRKAYSTFGIIAFAIIVMVVLGKK